MKKDQRPSKKSLSGGLVARLKRMLRKSLPEREQAGMPAQWALIPVIRHQPKQHKKYS